MKEKREKVILIYGSTTGNTETLAEGVVSGLKRGGTEVTVKDVTEAEVDKLLDYDVIVLGSSTWGDGELQDDFVDFYNKMDKVLLTGKKAAVFGPGDKESYPDTYCEAVNILEERLKKCGAEIIVKSFKVDGDIEPVMEVAESWGEEIVKSL
jgi:flavodoxin I